MCTCAPPHPQEGVCTFCFYFELLTNLNLGFYLNVYSQSQSLFKLGENIIMLISSPNVSIMKSSGIVIPGSLFLLHFYIVFMTFLSLSISFPISLTSTAFYVLYLSFSWGHNYLTRVFPQGIFSHRLHG